MLWGEKKLFPRLTILEHLNHFWKIIYPFSPTHHFCTSTYFDCILWDCRKVVGEWREIEVTRGGGEGAEEKKSEKGENNVLFTYPLPVFFLLTSLCVIPTRWTPKKGQFLRCTPSSPCLQALRGTVMYQAGIAGDRVWLWGLLCCLVCVTLIGYLKSHILTRLCKTERTVKKAI